MRFREAAEKWFEKKCLGWSESSRAKYGNILQKYLLPAFGDAVLEDDVSAGNGNSPDSGGNLQKIDSVDNGESLPEFESGLTKFGDSVEVEKIDSALVRNFAGRDLGELAVSTRRFVLATLQQILKSALSPEDFSALDFPHAGTPRKGEAVPLSPEELAALIRALEKNDPPRYENTAHVLLLIAFTGMRLGEACALRLSDFDFVRNTVRIHATLERLPVESGGTADGAKEKARTALQLLPAKTASGEREIPIPKKLLAWLKERAKGEPPEAPLVTRDPRTLQNHFQCFLKVAGISKDAHIHTLRHTFATHSLSAGADLKTLSATLGHASTHTTLDLYVHPTFESKHRLQEAFRQFIAHPEKWGWQGGNADWGGDFGKERPFG